MRAGFRVCKEFFVNEPPREEALRAAVVIRSALVQNGRSFSPVPALHARSASAA